jgi:molybdate transport system substrate-binding protein
MMIRAIGSGSILPRLLVLTTIAGCGSTQAVPNTSTATVRVAAASDLQAALPAIIERFRGQHAIEIEPVFGSSGQFARQIGQGGPFDLFLSANRAYVEDLASKGAIVPSSVRPYALGTLVIAVNKKSNATVTRLEDLASPEIKRIAIANPAFAPYGVAAREVLDRSKLTPAVASKLVMADSVRHAFQFVQTGNAEVGLVALSVASVPEVRTISVDSQLHAPIEQYQGIVSQARDKRSASTFAEYLRGDEARSILRSFGFNPIEGQAPSSGTSK